MARMKKISFSLIIAVLVFTSGTVLAQDFSSLLDNLSSISSEYLTIKTIPENPGPNERVSARLEFFSSDLNRAEISWYLNGELQKRGVGEVALDFQTGDLGEVSRISVVINTFEGENLQKEVVLIPAGVSLVWNAKTYTPPFYKGRSLFTHKSEVSISAVPEFVNSSGNRINPNNLIYRWYQGANFLQSQSGTGKNSINITGGIITRPLDIRVEVSTLDSSLMASKRLTIRTENPKVLIYEKNPLLGLMTNKVPDLINLEQREITLEAIPYFFNTIIKESFDVEYVWTQNLNRVRGEGNSLTLRQDEDALAGSVDIGVRALNRNNLLQASNHGIKINLGEIPRF